MNTYTYSILSSCYLLGWRKLNICFDLVMMEPLLEKALLSQLARVDDLNHGRRLGHRTVFKPVCQLKRKKSSCLKQCLKEKFPFSPSYDLLCMTATAENVATEIQLATKALQRQ